MSQDKSNKQGKASATATASATASPVEVKASTLKPGDAVGPSGKTTIPSGSGIEGDPANPAERRPLTAKERLLAKLQETPPVAAKRSKDNPVERQLDEIADVLRELKLGLNGKPKMTTKMIVAYLEGAEIRCSTATLSNWFAANGLTNLGKRGANKG